MTRFVIALSIRLSTYKTIVQKTAICHGKQPRNSVIQSCSRFRLQGWRNVARKNRVDLFSVVTWPDTHSLPKFNPLFLNAVIFGGRNTLTPFQIKCKPFLSKLLFKRSPLWNRDLSCRDSNHSNVFFNGRGQFASPNENFSQHFWILFSEPKKTLVCFSLFARARKRMHMCTLRERERNIWIEKGNSGVKLGGFEKKPFNNFIRQPGFSSWRHRCRKRRR